MDKAHSLTGITSWDVHDSSHLRTPLGNSRGWKGIIGLPLSLNRPLRRPRFGIATSGMNCRLVDYDKQLISYRKEYGLDQKTAAYLSVTNRSSKSRLNKKYPKPTF